MTARTASRRRRAASPDRPGEPVTVAGNGTAGFSGDDGPAPEARLAFPADVAVGGGAVFIADHANHRIRRIDGSGVLTTVAGDGLRGFAGDGADAVRARLGFPSALAVGPDGAVFFADEMNHRVRRIDPSGVVDTVAGDGTRGGDGDGGPADRARLDAPCALAVDGTGALYIGEAGSPRVRRIDGDGVISTVVTASGRSADAGTAGSGTADAGDAFVPAGLATDAAGQLYIADPAGRRVLLLRRDGTLRVLAGPPGGSGGALEVDWSAPCAVAVDAQGAVHVADLNGHRVWRLADGAATVMAGPDPATDAAVEADAVSEAAATSLAYPCGLAVDPAGRLLVADNFHHRIAALPLTAAPSRGAGKPGNEKKPGGKRKPGGEKKPEPEPERVKKPEPEPEGERAPQGHPVPQGHPDLLVRQEVGVEIPRGASELIHVRVSSTDPWVPGRVEHRFTAPTGFVFDGRATCAYYRADRTVLPGGTATAAVRDGGRELAVTDEPRLNTPDHPAAALVYTLGIRALPDAEPGRYTDGRAVVAGAPEVRLKASVLEDDED
ncbi:NHL domain-containing protein [Streptomyces olivochromogenes]|uniref:NHL domain-containing protein n=1 Tax=Streptomyces olivochromogenes TaxID=1963 RepID=UPI001F30E4A3|nr:serine/threonine protein kinase [Streptomyces olivochromogenes]